MHDAATLTPAQMRRAGIAATIGCALEFYDFLTFAFFAIQIGKTFFPSSSPYLSLMGSLATFWVGFLARPVGAYVLGHYGDKAGRKPAMLLSMGLMGVGILLLALTPGYATIGWAAPAIAVIARLLQGFALGGEVGTSTVYMIEAVPQRMRGLGASLQGIAQGIGQTAGTIVGLALSLWLTADQLTDYGWRIALLLGASIVPFALIIRNSLPETIDVAEPPAQIAGQPIPLRRIVLAGTLMISGSTMSTYVLLYLATFGQTQLGLGVTQSMTAQLAANLMVIVGSLLGGLYCDRRGRREAPRYAALALMALAVPAFAWVVEARSVWPFVAVSLVLSLIQTFRGASVYAAIAEGTDPAIRARVFGLVYSIPVMVFGGATQLGLTWLIEAAGTAMAAGWFLMAVNAISLTGALLLPETAPRKHAGTAAPAAA